MTQKNKQFQRTEDGRLILMSPEERKLLITDLIARIECGVICMIERVDDFGPRWRNEKLTGFCNEEDGCFYFVFNYGLTVDFVEKVKPYLRPMSSMTKEEREEVQVFICDEWFFEDSGFATKVRREGYIEFLANYDCSGIDPEFCGEYVDWLNSHHFDYRNLIEKGLALEAPEDMYKTE